jgi:hypothetical protein
VAYGGHVAAIAVAQCGGGALGALVLLDDVAGAPT